MTTKTLHLSNDKHNFQLEEYRYHKELEVNKKYAKNFESDESDVNLEGDIGIEEYQEDKAQV